MRKLTRPVVPPVLALRAPLRGVHDAAHRSHARWLLVEQATHYRVPPKVSPQLSERQRHTPRWIKDLSWKTQTRLSHRFSMLRKRGMHHNKIKTAIARELTAFVWELGTRFESGATQP